MKEFTGTGSAAARRSELFRGAVRDARAQLDEATATAERTASSTEEAQRAWRGANPGLAALIDYSEGADQ